MTTEKNRIAIAILALGGQGGGVLAEWIQHVAREDGWIAQGTSVPGVAQRTGSTVYYVELARPGADGRVPVMAQMPMPGDVDVVVASELMETGRAVLRGFATKERTTLIGSTHRVYAISEKQVAGDGRGNGDKIIAAAQERSARFIGFDMEAATEATHSVISAIMFGALAGSGALPFPREAFEQAIHHSGKAVKSNLAGFAEGFARAQGPVAMPAKAEADLPIPTTPAGQQLAARIYELPEAARTLAIHGAARLMDYQDAAYAGLYLDRLEQVARLDAAPFTLTAEVARHLALWMAYEDTIRVADLKVRASRFERIAQEMKLKDDQVLALTEFMHPRLQELAEVLPTGLARRLLNGGALSRWLEGRFTKGRHARTTGLRWFLLLRMVAALRGWRPRSLRYAQEQARIGEWLDAIATVTARDNTKAIEIARCQRLIKGYGDTFERGLDNFRWIMERHADVDCEQIREWREKALADDQAKHLSRVMAA
ncbi:indolepyruvate oxidoreductase subunit beta family protein [Novosphingobium rosa]|uniref:indolepyruvate oxidoreductase subunit beta family protein n=1 Tax=Novosphingobium rosa TaxID=76978 RepID=UPI0008330620|nr:indolepyruvate oxidoreductase subunit beta family protein [Novosphingobium rosa]